MPRPDYWQHKLSIYLHDPPHKALSIPGHEQRAKEIADLLGQTVAAREQYLAADMIASGLTRAAAPGHSADPAQNGSIDFAAHPVITHPVAYGAKLRLELPHGISIGKIHGELINILSKDISGFPAESAEERAKRLFLYLFFALKKRLRNENVGGLGGLWDVLPADTRIPDHSIWSHMALASAVGSSLREDETGAISLAVFSLTPVQPFIARARKLRDNWVGSVLLSYLAFTGIRRISETLGPDHIVYPSLHDQSLVEKWAARSFGLGNFLLEKDSLLSSFMREGESIASFPNKFVFLTPSSRVAELCASIQEAIQNEWLRIADIAARFIGGNGTTKELIGYQISDYWNFSYASVNLPRLEDKDALEKVLHPRKWRHEAETTEGFSDFYGDTGRLTARLYASSHSLVQSVLAASKQKPTRIRKPQHGEKCPLCGEHEVLHDMGNADLKPAREYAAGVTRFWNGLRERCNGADNYSEIGKSERLCAVCAVKRFLPRALKQSNQREELLYDVLAQAEAFPATTEIAAFRYLERLKQNVGIPEDKRKKLIDALHESEIDGLDDETSEGLKALRAEGRKHGIDFTDRDKYYAILLMDGDKMGDLINGETVNAKWGSVIHPELARRYEDKHYKPPNDKLKSRLADVRTINPALHASISDSLNSFARFAVAPIVAQGNGRLIYAGGDDICAILPIDSALDTADRIRRAYTAGFVRYTDTGAQQCTEPCSVEGRIGVHLGAAPGVSISAGIVIAHHKTPLREVLKDAHALLEGVAKKKAGRNAFAVRLKKRSGGDRDFYCKWDQDNPFLPGETILASFREIVRGVGTVFSSSLLYRLSALKDGIDPMKDSLALNRHKIVRMYQYEVSHSGLPKDIDPHGAERLAGITLATEGGEIRRASDGTPVDDWFTPETAVIADFLAGKERI